MSEKKNKNQLNNLFPLLNIHSLQELLSQEISGPEAFKGTIPDSLIKHL